MASGRWRVARDDRRRRSAGSVMARRVASTAAADPAQSRCRSTLRRGRNGAGGGAQQVAVVARAVDGRGGRVRTSRRHRDDWPTDRAPRRRRRRRPRRSGVGPDGVRGVRARAFARTFRVRTKSLIPRASQSTTRCALRTTAVLDYCGPRTILNG